LKIFPNISLNTANRILSKIDLAFVVKGLGNVKRFDNQVNYHLTKYSFCRILVILINALCIVQIRKSDGVQSDPFYFIVGNLGQSVEIAR